jgi:RNA polymerase sigma-70 factor (ECF subfamily)
MTRFTHSPLELQTTVLAVSGMSCGACVRHVTRALEGMTGVLHVEVDVEAHLATIDHCPSSVDVTALTAAIRDAGYDARPTDHGTSVQSRSMDAAETPAPIQALLDNHRAFLRYLERRVGDRALAEDLLQDAFAKVVARPGQAPSDEGVVPWFYRTLRNAAIDQFRRRGAADRAHESFARELETHETPAPEREREICACVSRLASTLKPEYAEALQAIEVGGTPVKTFAEQKGLSSGNAAVRVFRAREALKKRVSESCGTCAEHGCFDCTCRARQVGGGASRPSAS